MVLWTLLGLILLVIAGGGGSYLWFRSQVHASNQRVDPAVKQVEGTVPSSTAVSVSVPVPASPSAMNIVVLGTDKRANETGDSGRSDTLMVVHVDPDQNYLSILSIPRDLRVDVPGYGKQKINSAYAYGGAALTIKTVSQLTGMAIGRYVEVDFNAFKDITDSLGGVYVDVDRRYYNDNPTWELIKLAPGYQLLKGDNALGYVRYRHDLNMDFGRMERQQRFLAAAREQAMGWNLPFKLPGLVSALFKNISTDLGANYVLKLANWGVKLNGDRIRQVSLIGTPEQIGTGSYVVATNAELAAAVTKLLTPPSASGQQASSSSGTTQGAVTQGDIIPGEAPGSSSTTTTVPMKVDLSTTTLDILNGMGVTDYGAATSDWFKSLGATVNSVGTADQSPRNTTTVLYPTGQSTAAHLVGQAVQADSVTRSSAVSRITVTLGTGFQLPAAYQPPVSAETIPNSSEWKALATMISFKLEGPGYLPDGYKYIDRMPPIGGTYDIQVGGGTKPALKMIYQLRIHGSETDQYMGITETTWTSAPAASGGQEVQHNGVIFTIVGTTQKVDHIWWKKGGTLYWVSNTLSYYLSKQEMLKVAESMIDIPQP